MNGAFVCSGLLAVLLLLSAGPLFAQTREDTFRRADSNGDEVIDSAENAAFVDKDFDEQDASRDGRIGVADLEVWLRTHVYGHQPGTPVALPANAVREVALRDIELKDRDGDGFISRDEHRSAAASFFKAMDRDRDGKLSHDEFGRPAPPSK